jgi:purine-cytosine permease-like protein
VYVALTVDHIHLDTAKALPTGSTQSVIGAAILVMTGFGLGWVNTAADYSRYLPRRASSAGVVWWPTFGGSLPVVLLVVYGILLAGSSQSLSAAIGSDPIGALTTILPTWFLLPFAIVAVLGLVSGAVMDIYSSGLTLLTLGLPAPRWVAAAIDGVLMVVGAIYIVFYADSDFVVIFEAFLIILGVPMAAWCGVFLADVLMRRRDYDEASCSPRRHLRPVPAELGAVHGARHLGRLGAGDRHHRRREAPRLARLLPGRHHRRRGELPPHLVRPRWHGRRLAYANLGVPVALAIGFVGYLVFGFAGVRRQERALRDRTAATSDPAPATT